MKSGAVFIFSIALLRLADAFGYLQSLGADESSKIAEIETRLDAIDALGLEVRLEAFDALELRLEALVNGVDISSSTDCYKLGTVGDMTCPGMSDVLTSRPVCHCSSSYGMACSSHGSGLCFPEIKDKGSCETWFASVAEAQATWTEQCLTGQGQIYYTGFQFSDMSRLPSGKCYGHVYVPSDPYPDDWEQAWEQHLANSRGDLSYSYSDS